jgi:hypothetical protein
MSARRTQEADVSTQPAAEGAARPTAGSRWTTELPGRERPTVAPRSRAEAEERYVAARDAWTKAMSRASSGRSADLASLAIAQQAYEEATAERNRWLTGRPMAIPIQPEPERTKIDVIVGQELAWRQVHETGRRSPNLLGRVARRLGRR